MNFLEWLQRYCGTDDDVTMIARWAVEVGGSLSRVKRWDECAKIGQQEQLGDEGMCSLKIAWDKWRDAIGYVEPVPAPQQNPLSQPYTPGAKTTLADARLQLVSCALMGMSKDEWSGPELIKSAIDLADSALKAMRG